MKELTRWAIPVVAVAAAAGLGPAIELWFNTGAPYMLFVLAVTVTAFAAGAGPSVIAVLLSLIAVSSLFPHPRGVGHIVGLCMFLTTSLGISCLGYILQRARESARALAARQRATFDQAGVGLVEVEGEDDHFIAVNDHACRVLGRSRDELLKLNVHELTWFEDRALSNRRNLELHRGLRSAIDYEKRYTRGDGSPVWVHVTVRAVRDSKGRWQRSITTIEDISERKRAEEALRRSESRFRAFFENSAVGALQLDAEGRIMLVNDRYCEIIGYSREELVGRSPAELSHPDDRAEHEAYLRRFLQGEISPYRLEKRCVRKGGEMIWVRVVAGLIRDGADQGLRAVAVTEDVTETKLAEAELAEARRRLDMALIAGEIGTFDWDIVHDKLRGDHKFTEIFNVDVDPNSDAAPLATYMQVIHPEDRHAVMERLMHSVETGAPYEAESRILSGPRVRWIVGRGKVERDTSGTVTRFSGVVLDITERKRLEDELRAALLDAERAKFDAEQANQSKDQFLAVLSHELRTPLTPVLAAVSLMRKSSELPGTFQDHLEVIQRNVTLEARLIDDLLDLTRIARGKILLDKVRVDLKAVLNRASEVCRPDIEARGIHFKLYTLSTAIPVYVDVARLQQVVWNLLNNSVKFTPHGGCIGVSALCRDGHAVIEVTDSGIGIGEEALPKIFDAFEQTDKRITRQFGGLGLGLAITKRLVELHDGAISAESSGKDAGAKFKVVLPLHHESVESETFMSKAAEIDLGDAKRVLLVEDHGDTALMMKKLLQVSGFEVETAGDVAQALHSMQSGTFQILISDLGLPDRSGLELVRELRRQGAEIPAIALSGYGREEDIRRSKEAGFDEHLTKPVNFEELISTVGRVVHHT